MRRHKYIKKHKNIKRNASSCALIFYKLGYVAQKYNSGLRRLIVDVSRSHAISKRTIARPRTQVPDRIAMKMEQCVPKRWHIKFRHRGIA